MQHNTDNEKKMLRAGLSQQAIEAGVKATATACQKAPTLETGITVMELRRRHAIKKAQKPLRDLAIKAQHADKLAEALRDAADWLSRSTRIDDQEQASDARKALAAYEEAKQ